MPLDGRRLRMETQRVRVGPLYALVALAPMQRHVLGNPFLAVGAAGDVFRNGARTDAGVVNGAEEIAEPRARHRGFHAAPGKIAASCGWQREWYRPGCRQAQRCRVRRNSCSRMTLLMSAPLRAIAHRTVLTRLPHVSLDHPWIKAEQAAIQSATTTCRVFPKTRGATTAVSFRDMLGWPWQASLRAAGASATPQGSKRQNP